MLQFIIIIKNSDGQSSEDSMLNKIAAHLNNLLALCWSDKVSENFFDNVLAFGGL